MQTEQRRIVLFIALAIIMGLLWNAWRDAHPAVKPSQVNTASINNNTQNTNEPTISAVVHNVVSDATHSNNLPLIQVKTNVLNIKINPYGGNIVYASLLKYPVSQKSDQPVVMMNTNKGTEYLAQSMLVAKDGKGTDGVVFTASQSEYQLKDGDTKLVVNLVGRTQSGLIINKAYTFYPDKYNIDVDFTVKNTSDSSWDGALYTSLTRADSQTKSSGLFHISSYFGASYSTKDDAYNKVSFKKMNKDNLSEISQGGWIAMQQHYFLGAWVPNKNQKNHYYSSVSNDDLYTIGVNGPDYTINPGQEQKFSSVFYVGPEIASNLKALAPHLEMTIDYGFLWFISVIIFWLLQKIYLIIGNWGFSIILVTIIIKLLFYKLSATSYRSMARMRVLQPKIKALQERYADDKQKLTKATMELYKTEKANPLSGCLPILVQIPVFIALYWVLVESVQLRQAPFIFWITDLSLKDPYYVLPILNGLAMFVQQKLNPPPPDPTQAKMMMLMPVFLTFVFLNFPAGLVLYWLVNSVFSIAQQYYIMKTLDKHTAKIKNKAKIKAKRKA